MNRISCISATKEAGKAFYLRQIQGPVVMLDLLKFKSIADYSEATALAHVSEIDSATLSEMILPL